MIHVTDSALDTLKGLLPDGSGQDRAPRLEASGSGALGIVAGTVRRGDCAIEHDGLTVLVIGAALAARLEGARLDTEEAPTGRRQLILTAPRSRDARRIGA